MSWLVPAVIGAGTLLANWASARRQSKENRKFAEYQNLVNSQMLDKQLAYDTPKNQMARFQDAGLNPNLIYGQGSPGNQGSPQQSAEFKVPDYQQVTSSLGPLLNQSLMTQSQVQATDARTRQTGVLTQLNELQVRVLERNPLLDAGAYNAIIQSLKSAAEIKASESHILDTKSVGLNMVLPNGMKVGEQMIIKELELLEQRYNLGTLDQKIKAEVLQSKDFQNAILEIQKKWMTNAEITPQHIYQFIQLFLMKLL